MKFHLLNIGNRKKALNQGSFCVNQQINEKQITRDELLERLENNDESLPRKFISMSANIPNTAAFWKDAKRKLDSLCFFVLYEDDVIPVYFDTGSCAEHRWISLHTLIAKYLASMSNEDESTILDRITNDAQFRH